MHRCLTHAFFCCCVFFVSFNLSIRALALREFQGQTFVKKPSFKSIADEWAALAGTKRSRTSTTVMIGGDAVKRENNYDMHSDYGRPQLARDKGVVVNVKYKRFADHEAYWYVHGIKQATHTLGRAAHPTLSFELS